MLVFAHTATCRRPSATAHVHKHARSHAATHMQNQQMHTLASRTACLANQIPPAHALPQTSLPACCSMRLSKVQLSKLIYVARCCAMMPAVGLEAFREPHAPPAMHHAAQCTGAPAQCNCLGNGAACTMFTEKLCLRRADSSTHGAQSSRLNLCGGCSFCTCPPSLHPPQMGGWAEQVTTCEYTSLPAARS